jgi:hypothetical protein
MHLRVHMHEHFDLITNPIKYKCETCKVCIHPFQKNCDEWKMQFINGFNTLKWAIQFMWKYWLFNNCKKIH